MWNILWYLIIINISIYCFLLSVVITIKLVFAIVVEKETSKELINELLLKYGMWWGSTLIALMLS